MGPASQTELSASAALALCVLWEAAFEDAVEGHSKSAKLEFLGWLQARGTLHANGNEGGVTTRTPHVEPPPLLAEEVGGDGALEVAPTVDEE